MPIRTYNNNNNQITNTTYSSISFANSESDIAKTRISISYFNKLMKISIAKSNGSNGQFNTYDNDNAPTVYVSFSKAIILSRLIREKLLTGEADNVCIELKNGLLKVSNGKEYNSSSPCISISTADQSGNITETIYQCKTNYYSGAYNYFDGKFESVFYDDIELETFVMVLEEYYKASSYAIAATVMEANMYKRDSQYNLIRQIAEKTGVQVGSSNSNNYNNKTFLASGSNNGINGIPKEYEQATFDDIANSMRG